MELVSGNVYTAEALGRRHAGARPSAQRAGVALAVAGLCLLLLVVVWAAATHSPLLRLKDAVALHEFTLLDRPSVESVGSFLLHLLEPLLFTIWGAALVLVAIARGRPRVAAVAAALLALAPLTSETLKPLLAHPHVAFGGTRIGAASWPSGHATSALTLVLCAVLVAPARRRPLVAAIGACFALAVGIALLVLAWHMPSDVIGGYLVAILWTALAVAYLRFADSRRPPAQL
jgi:membrane-associated phospholipid phosphatase